MSKQITIGIILILGSLLVAACNVPFGGEQAEPEAPAPEVEAPAEQPTEDPKSEPIEAPEETIEEPQGTPIAHLDPETLILVTHIQMISAERGWGIGGLDGSSDHVLRTNDGGQTWMDVTPPEPAPDPENPAKSAVSYFINPMTGWVAYYGDTTEPSPGRFRVWGTMDGGDTWSSSRALELEFLGSMDYPPILVFEDADNGWLIARHGPAGMHNYPIYLLRTADGGRNWEMAITPAEGGLQSCRKSGVDFGTLMVGWATVADCPVVAPEVAVTRDGGRNWEMAITPAEGGLQSCRKSGVDFGTLMVGWATVADCPVVAPEVAVTRDGGRNWEMAITPAEGGLQSCRKSGVDFGTLMVGWATVADCPVVAPEVAVTRDGGRNWEPIVLPAPDSRPQLFETELCEGHSPQLVSELIGAVAVSCRTGLNLNYIYTTQDGGATWESHLYPGGELSLLSPRTAFAFDRHIHQTLDGGQSWEFVKTVQWDGQFNFVSEQIGWAVARDGDALALVSTTNGGRTWNLLKPSITS